MIYRTLIFLCVSVLFIGTANARTTITVDTLDDDLDVNGNCTLREAIQAAENNTAVDGCAAGSGADVIRFSVSDTLRLSATITNSWPWLTEDLTLEGPGVDQLTIDGSASTSSRYLIYSQQGDPTLGLSGLTVTGFEAGVFLNGGGTIMISDCVFVANDQGVELSGAQGTIERSRFVRNGHAEISGAGMAITQSTVLVRDSEFANNIASRGGAMNLQDDTDLMLDKVTIRDNQARYGGGLASWGNSRVLIRHSSITGNGAVPIQPGDDTNQGGGLNLRFSTQVDVENSTISDNTAIQNGGGVLISDSAVLRLFNVTLSDNIADADGNNDGTGGGIWSFQGQVEMRNTIIASNEAADDMTDISGRGYTSFGYNLVGNPTAFSFASDATDLVGTGDQPLDPQLAPLADHGGPTPSRAILASSPALNAANPAGCLGADGNLLSQDQRGENRVQDARCDIGAVEGVAEEINQPPSAPVLTAPDNTNLIVVTGDPATPFVAEWTPASDPDGNTIQYTWELSDNPAFTNTWISADVGTATRYETDYGVLAALMTQRNVGLTDQVTLYHHVVATDGQASTLSEPVALDLARGTLTDTENSETPSGFALEQNYPNPFNPATTITYTLAAPAPVRLTVYDMLGREVAVLVDQQQASGLHTISFDGAALPGGTYLYRLQAGAFSQAHMMSLFK